MTPKSPPKLTLTSLNAFSERLTAQFNPTQLELAIAANYNKVVIPGMSHELLQFSHTSNLSLKFDLYFRVTDPDAGLKTEAAKRLGAQQFSTSTPTQDVANTAFLHPSATERFTLEDRRNAEAFLLAHVTPQAGDRGIRLSAPASILVVWPNYLSFESVLTAVTFRATRFNSAGHPVEVTASVQMEELRDLRYTDLDVLLSDFDRAGRAYVPGT